MTDKVVAGLTPAQDALLRVIDAAGVTTPAALRGLMSIKPVMIHRHLKKLCQLGFLFKRGRPPKVVYASKKELLTKHYLHESPGVESPCFIYVIKDPANNRVVFVGKTTAGTGRWAQHLHYRSRTKLGDWIAGLRLKNLKPTFEVIHYCPAHLLDERESIFVDYHLRVGFELFDDC